MITYMPLCVTWYIHTYSRKVFSPIPSFEFIYRYFDACARTSIFWRESSCFIGRLTSPFFLFPFWLIRKDGHANTLHRKWVQLIPLTCTGRKIRRIIKREICVRVLKNEAFSHEWLCQKACVQMKKDEERRA